MMEPLDMPKRVQRVYLRGYNAAYNEANPFSRSMGQFYWWNAGFVDAWGSTPKATIKNNEDNK